MNAMANSVLLCSEYYNVACAETIWAAKAIEGASFWRKTVAL